MRLPLSEVNQMNLRECFNAIEGFSELKRSEFSVMFYCAQYNAIKTAFSKEQAKNTANDKNPYLEVIKTRKKALSFDSLKSELKVLTNGKKTSIVHHKRQPKQLGEEPS